MLAGEPSLKRLFLQSIFFSPLFNIIHPVRGERFSFLCFTFLGFFWQLVQHPRHMDGFVMDGFCIVLVSNEDAVTQGTLKLISIYPDKDK